MTSDQQESEFNNTVKKPTGLNPNADAFFYRKAEIPTVSNNLDPAHGTVILANGDVKADDMGGGFTSGDSPVSDSPPAPCVESVGTGCDPPTAVDSKPTQALNTGSDTCQEVNTGSDSPQAVGTGSDASQVVAQSSAETEETGSMASATESGVASAPMEGAVGAVTAQGVEASTPSEQPSSQPKGAMAAAVMENGLANGAVDLYGAEEAARARYSGSQSASPELRLQLLNQLEYYFSRENLEQDHYLQSQMDGDQYVPIATIASFNQVVRLTRDYDLVVEILRSSNQVQVDSTGTKVRPKYNRSVLMLREIPQDTPKSEVEAIFDHENCPKLVSCEFAHNGYWYIKFKTDKDASDAFLFLRENEITFRDKPVMARIKAKPLVRSVGGSVHFMQHSLSSGGQQQQHQQPQQHQQQNGSMSFIAQQPQAQFPVMAGPIPPYINQVTQTLPQYQLYNFQALIPQWPTPNAAPQFLDPGAILAMNGYQASSVKSASNHSRNIFHPIRSNNRGCHHCAGTAALQHCEKRANMGKPHRTQSASTDKASDNRPGERFHPHNNPSSTRSNPRSNHSNPESRLQPSLSGRSRSEGASSNGPISQAAAQVSVAPMPLVAESPGLQAQSALPPNSRADPVATAPHPKRGGNYRKLRRNEDGPRNSKSHPASGNRDGRLHEPHFDLEATSFPPLPGSSSNSSSSETPDGSRLSDVVRGATNSRSSTDTDESIKPTPSTSTAAIPPSVPAAATVSVPKCTISTSLSNMGSNPSVSTTATVASPMSKESLPASHSAKSTTTEPACDKAKTVVESSTHLPKSIKASAPAAAASIPVSEAVSEAAKAVPVCSSSQAQSATAPASATVDRPVSALGSGTNPVKLSYAEMVAGKHQTENSVKMSVEDGMATRASPVTATAQTSQPEQTSTPSSSSVSASAPQRSATARPSHRDHSRRDYEPREQRYQGNRRTRDYRDHRQSRFEPRRNERDVKVPTK